MNNTTRTILGTSLSILDAARRAGSELSETGRMEPATLSEVSLPLVAEKELRRTYDTWV
jgi:hypothetical protein